MSVRSLTITGFRSFKKARWRPDRLNVLIGPNGSGKSNLLQSLEVIRAAAAGNLRDFILNKGGLPRLLWCGKVDEIDFVITTDPTSTQSSSPDQLYTFCLVPVPQSGSFRVSSELLGFNSPDRGLMVREGNELTVPEKEGSSADGGTRPLPETETALSMVSALWKHPVPYLFQQELRAWAIYHDLRADENAAVRRPAVVRLETRIAQDGENLTPVLKTLYEGDFKDAIDRGMSAAFPDDYDELFFRQTEPDRIQLYVRRKHGSREDSASDLSDGTLRFLLLLTILGTPDPPPLIAIDEPESGLHPSMLPIIAEFAADAATRTQVILSTHSPQMLDAFGENLPTATVFNWAGDHTELKTITGDELKKWVDDYSLGRFIFSGEAEAVL
jgi:predicted ATPase